MSFYSLITANFITTYWHVGHNVGVTCSFCDIKWSVQQNVELARKSIIITVYGKSLILVFPQCTPYTHKALDSKQLINRVLFLYVGAKYLLG